MTALYTYRREKVTLAIALQDAPTDAIALVYAPGQCGFAKIAEGNLLQRFPHAYEVRAFNEHLELRWLNASNGVGNAAILSDSKKSITDWTLISEPELDTNNTQYLLWGEFVKPLSGGWTQLGAARIGALPVPIPGVGKDQRVHLCAVEYIAVDEYGSAFVCEERLTKLCLDGENCNG